MSELEQDDNDFYACADEFINHANKMRISRDSSKVSSSLMFASARYSAFNATNITQIDKAEIINYLTEQYRAMVTHHLEDPEL